MRSFLLLVAIIGVLLCPYNCAVRAVASRALRVEQSAAGPLTPTADCCDACRGKKPVQSPDSPVQESESETSCVCEGALFEAAARTLLDSPWLFATTGDLVQPVTALASLKSCGVRLATAELAFADGWQLRIKMRSLLI